MLPASLCVRLAPAMNLRLGIQASASAGAKAVVLEALDDLAPQRLGETGRRDLRHLLRTTELTLVAMVTPVRRAIESTDRLDDRLIRIEQVAQMAYELGTRTILMTPGPLPESEGQARAKFDDHLAEMALRCDRHGTELTLDHGQESPRQWAKFFTKHDMPLIRMSVDPNLLTREQTDPVDAISTVADRVSHAYALDLYSPRRQMARGLLSSRSLPPDLVMDWEAYLGLLEEIGYRQPLTVVPPTEGEIGRTLDRIHAELQQVT